MRWLLRRDLDEQNFPNSPPTRPSNESSSCSVANTVDVEAEWDNVHTGGKAFEARGRRKWRIVAVMGKAAIRRRDLGVLTRWS